MGEGLTFDEIKARFPSEWVLIVDPQTDDSLEVVSGAVLYQSLDRNQVDAKLLELRPARFALRFLGSPPDGLALVL